MIKKHLTNVFNSKIIQFCLFLCCKFYQNISYYDFNSFTQLQDFKRKKIDKYYYSAFNDVNIDKTNSNGNNNANINNSDTIILKKEIDKWNNFSSVLRKQN